MTHIMQFLSMLLFVLALAAASAGAFFYGDNLDTKPINKKFKTFGLAGMAVGIFLAIFALYRDGRGGSSLMTSASYE